MPYSLLPPQLPPQIPGLHRPPSHLAFGELSEFKEVKPASTNAKASPRLPLDKSRGTNNSIAPSQPSGSRLEWSPRLSPALPLPLPPPPLTDAKWLGLPGGIGYPVVAQSSIPLGSPPPAPRTITIPVQAPPPSPSGQRRADASFLESRTNRLDARTLPGHDATPPILLPADTLNLLDLKADRQEYDRDRHVLQAYGRVVMRFRGTLLDADRLQINLLNRFVVAEGNVVLTRGNQILRGERFEYDLVRGAGVVFNANGEISLRTIEKDSDPTFSQVQIDAGVFNLPEKPLGDRLSSNQPPRAVTNSDNIVIETGAGANSPGSQQTGQVRHLRYQAERLNFTPQGWEGENLRFTNDPFSPPGLEFRADRATYTFLGPGEDLLETSEQRVVLDQTLSVPVPRSSLRNRNIEPGLAVIGIDGRDRDGIYVERGFKIFSVNSVSLTLTPQILVQRALTVQNLNPLDYFGLVAEVNAQIGADANLTGLASFSGLDLSNIENRLRASVRIQKPLEANTLTLEASYRDRLFNGSLGFQDVQFTIGGLLTSPVFPIGDTGINFTYQVAGQLINSDTDRTDLLTSSRPNNRVTLSRLQGAAALNRGFYLWVGDALPATADAGLRYTAKPVVPYLQLTTEIRGVTGFYSSGDGQSTITGAIGLQGQFGHFSEPFGDFTGFNINYSQTIRTGLSPFLFDRAVDTRVLSGGILQQIYGPLRFGVQTSVNLDTNQQISTEYSLEYSRRAYGIVVRYNPVQQLGSIGIRISDFDWMGGTEPFDGPPAGAVKKSPR